MAVNSFKRILTVFLVLLSVVVVGAVSQIGATAQTAAGVPQLLQQILSAVADLQKSVDAIENVNFKNVRFTPPVFNFTFSGENGGCEVVNVSDSSRTVETVARSFNGAVVDSKTSVLGPGAIDALTISPIGQFSCKFTVVGGSRTDIRATAFIGAGTRNVLSVPAE
jgi:hypothetical protein